MLQTNHCHEMEIIKPKPAKNKSSKLARTFQKVISLKTATKFTSNKVIFMRKPQARAKEEDPFTHKDTKTHNKSREAMEAIIARLFASVTTIKAAYAELQLAQQPYNNEAIQAADKAVVDELVSISDLKRCFLKKELNFSPQVTLMLAAVQEQQSQMKAYQITIKKLEAEVDSKNSEISALEKELGECIAFNKSLEKKLHSSGSLPMLESLHLSVLKPTHFIFYLNHTLRSMRSFTKMMIRGMESANWDFEAAAKSITPDAVFAKPSHQCFAFESFVCFTMFEGFNFPNFTRPIPIEKPLEKHFYFDNFKKLKTLNPKRCLEQNPDSPFARFLKSKYLQVVHAKMECSFFGNLKERKKLVLNNGGFPDSSFFVAFAEMAKRVFALHCLAFSFGEEVTVFQVKKNTRFSEVYMTECEAEQLVSASGEASGSGSGELRVGFTVVPGIMIGKTVIQSQVYLSPAS